MGLGELRWGDLAVEMIKTSRFKPPRGGGHISMLRRRVITSGTQVRDLAGQKNESDDTETDGLSSDASQLPGNRGNRPSAMLTVTMQITVLIHSVLTAVLVEIVRFPMAPEHTSPKLQL